MIKRGRRTTARSEPRAAAAAAWMRAGLPVLAWMAVLGGAVWVMASIQPHASQIVARQQVRLQWERLPSWWAQQPALLRSLEARAGLAEDDRIDDPRLCGRIAANLAAQGWVARVNRVRALASGVVRVDADLREPLAMVAHEGRAYAVDEHGVRLPYSERLTDDLRREWYVIEGAGGPPAEGQPWAGGRLTAGLKLADYLLRAEALDQAPFRPLLRAIDVSNVGRRVDGRAGELRLRTVHPDAVVHWGLPPGEEHQIEAKAERKLRYLNEIHRAGELLKPLNIDIRDHDYPRRW